MVMEVVDDLNYLLVKIDNDLLEVRSLIDLSLLKTITTTGFPYQKMTWNECECSLFLTGNLGGNAQVHTLDLKTDTLTNHYDSVDYSNNNSIIDKDGNLLIFTVDKSGSSPFSVYVQKWSACGTPQLLETVDTGIEMLFVDFGNLLGIMEDDYGNIHLTYADPVLGSTLSVLNSNYQEVYTKTLYDPSSNIFEYGVFSSNIAPSWTNTGLDLGTAYVYAHSHNQNGKKVHMQQSQRQVKQRLNHNKAINWKTNHPID